MSIVILREKSSKLRRLEAQNSHFFFLVCGQKISYWKTIYLLCVLAKEKRRQENRKQGKIRGKKRGNFKTEGKRREKKRKDRKGKTISVTDSKSNYKRQWGDRIA